MTAVLSALDPLRKENIMGSLDDSHVNYSPSSATSTDWKSKYYEVADMLQETKNELDDFHQSSKELEEELERELQRTEKAQQDLKVKVERAEAERDQWKSKFMSLQTNHNTTTTSLQRELDTLRQDYQKIKVQLRELEMGNDDLERNERAVSSSLADIESKYARALEEKILLEHELLDKASLEEECQRLKDELRDSNVEASILRDQLEAAQARGSTFTVASSFSEQASSTMSSVPHLPPTPSDDDLLHTQPPADLQLADLSPESEVPEAEVPETPRPSTSSLGSEAGQSALLQRAGFALPRHKFTSPQTPTSLGRSTTLPSLSTPTRLPPRTTVTRPTPRPIATPLTVNTAGSVTASKNKGVQMVSEMRARVKNLEQKIHTRVPRLRMGSTSRPNANSVTTSSISKPSSLTSSSSNPSLHAKSPDERSRPSLLSRHSADYDEKKRTPVGDSSGWVLIMEDSPSPTKTRANDFRRASSPSTTSSTYRPYLSTAGSPPPTHSDPKDVLSRSVMPSGLRRPQSRLSTSTEGRSSVSTTATVSSIPTPTSRPATPTFLPLPSAGLYAHQSTAGATGLKRSTGPGLGPYSNPKRSSLGSSSAGSPTNVNYLSDSGIPSFRERPTSVPALSRVANGGSSSSPSSYKESPSTKALPSLPHSNVTVRSGSKLPSPALSQSRIGRPNFGVSGRRSAGGEGSDLESKLLDARDKTRPRSGSHAFGRG
ncbi:hypothetical protein BV25DRAFT_1911374 [Artomyces pyxidatus]|uniref:Uncharacterized protein n=1 Tax=Artomyces pyxidatus TaxID=48021 RepID=A0ACB8TIX0_9AGAM|nr:hypothetical protein BV25DRAFT_1911374 [Artomyces pyxidatus]